jgi:hypothetical protein
MKRKFILLFPTFFLLLSLLLVRFSNPIYHNDDELGRSVLPETGQKTQLPKDREGAVADAPLYWLDEFEYQHPRWDWEYNQGTGYKSLIELPDGSPGLEIGVTDNSDQNSYSDCSLRENTEVYEYGVMEARLRLTDDNGLTDDGKGTRGWGFWDGNLDVLNVAWFWSASPESEPEISGFRVMVMRDHEFLLNQEIQVDMRAWHTYRVELTQEGTKFFIDGVEIASTPGRPANQQRVELWVDNMAVHINNGSYSTENLNLIQDQIMYIDWVQYQSSPIELRDQHLFLPWISR